MHIDGVPNRGSRPPICCASRFAKATGAQAHAGQPIRALRRQIGHPRDPAREASPAESCSRPSPRARTGSGGGACSHAASRHRPPHWHAASRERELVCAMVAARVLAPHTKLATTRWWHTTTLAEEFGVGDANEDDLYAAMDWLLERQGRSRRSSPRGTSRRAGLGALRPELELLRRQLLSVGQDWATTATARRASSRSTTAWSPTRAAVRLRSRCSTATPSIAKPCCRRSARFSDEFGIERFVVVGDRGMISQKAIDELKTLAGVDWITALKSAQIRSLVEGGRPAARPL